MDKIYISESKISKAGRGIFAKGLIRKGELIEECPMIILPRTDYLITKKTILRNYYFMWGRSTSAICLGYGSLYNHSYTPNATYKKNIKEKTIDFIVLADIKKNEEIMVNYNYGQADDNSSLWIKEIKPAS